MQTVLPYCDIVVGNSDEALALAENFKFNVTELHEVAKMLADLPKHNKLRKRIVMITQQELPVIVYSGLFFLHQFIYGDNVDYYIELFFGCHFNHYVIANYYDTILTVYVSKSQMAQLWSIQ